MKVELFTLLKNSFGPKEKTMIREYTNQLLEMVDEGLLDRDTVIMACVKYMSEDEVCDMMFANEFVLETDEEDEEEAI
jgi:hypothetical protein